jgi:hypothetical protein
MIFGSKGFGKKVEPLGVSDEESVVACKFASNQ